MRGLSAFLRRCLSDPGGSVPRDCPIGGLRGARAMRDPCSDKLVQKLIDLGADVNLKNSSDCPALWLASCNTVKDSTENVVEMLANHPKIDINFTNQYGDPLLFVVAFYSNKTTTPKTIELLLRHPDINVNQMQPSTNKTALMMVAQNLGGHSSKDCLKMLMKHPKIDMNLKDAHGATAMDYLLQHLKV